MLPHSAKSPMSWPEKDRMSRPAPNRQSAKRSTGEAISFLMDTALARPELISLAAGFVDQQTLPVEATQAALEALFSDVDRARTALQYGTTMGYRPLREAVLAQLIQRDGPNAALDNVSADQILVTAGSNQLLHLLGEVMFEPGDIVLCGSPSYFVFLGTVLGQGVRSVGVASDASGIKPEALNEELSRLEATGELHRVRAIYVVSYYDNPAGVTLPADRRAEIADLARRFSRDRTIYVIEDAAYRELRYRGDDTPSIRSYDPDGGTVVLAQTFSKSFSPGIRVGWGVLPPALVGPVSDLKSNIDFGSPNFSQHLMATVLELGLFDAHVDRLRQSYRQKLDAMLEACDEHLAAIDGVHWVRPDGGLYVWLELPDHIDAGPDGPLFDLAMAEGMFYVPGEYFYAAEGCVARGNTIRLSFGVQSCPRIREGVAALARAIRQAV